jgi:hypothetical protein
LKEQLFHVEKINAIYSFINKLKNDIETSAILRKKLINSFLSGELLIPKGALK